MSTMAGRLHHSRTWRLRRVMRFRSTWEQLCGARASAAFSPMAARRPYYPARLRKCQTQARTRGEVGNRSSRRPGFLRPQHLSEVQAQDFPLAQTSRFRELRAEETPRPIKSQLPPRTCRALMSRMPSSNPGQIRIGRTRRRQFRISNQRLDPRCSPIL